MTSNMIEALSERENEVLQAMADGLTNQEIANSLYVALATVKWYNTQIYSKLGVNNRQDAVEQAHKLGLLNSEKQLLPDVPHNLTQPTTPFIGRYEELRELNDLLNNPAVRLVTILAQGGMGKTRLTVECAYQQLANFPDGVFLVELASLNKQETIVSSIVEVLQLAGYDSEPKQAILSYLQNQQILLLLDNFEHLLEGAAIVSDILQVAPKVKILVTSRERLNIRGENSFVLSGMAVPLLESDNLANYDSIRLFLDSAKRLRSDYDLDEPDLPHVVEICHLVDGLPLGIELAAGWLDVLSPEKIAVELHHSIDILETEMRDMPERHRSIRATFNQSWERLSEPEQQVMMRVSIFRGSFSQDAVASVAGANIRTLRRLLNKSLLHVDTGERYSIHELLRQYCEERLEESGGYDDALNQHAAYYVEYMEKTELMRSIQDPTIIKEVDAEVENLIMAWEYVVAHEEFDDFRKILSLENYLNLRGRGTEVIMLLQTAFERVRNKVIERPELKELYCELLLLVVYFKHQYTEVGKDDIIEVAEKVIELLEPEGFSDLLMTAYLFPSSRLLWNPTIDFDRIQHDLEKAWFLAETGESMLWQFRILSVRAYHYHRIGEQEAALNIVQQAEQLIEQIAQQQALPRNTRQGFFEEAIRVYLDAQMYEKAEKWIDEELYIAERNEAVYPLSVARGYKAQIALARSDISGAKQEFAAIIYWHQTHARDWQMLGTLWANYVNLFLMKIGEDERAVEIASFVMHHPVAIQLHIDGAKKSLEELHAHMVDDSFEAAYERGKQMELKQVVADAMAFLTE